MYVPKSSVSLSLQEIADHLNATLTVNHIPEADAASARIVSLCSLDEPLPSGISFAKAENTRSAAEMLSPHSLGALIVKSGMIDHVKGLHIPLLEVLEPHLAFCSLVPLFFDKISFGSGIHPQSIIAPTAQLGKDISIGAFAVVGDHVTIGDGAIIHPHAVIYPFAQLGNFVTIHAGAIVRERVVIGDLVTIQCGAVIGGDGFGYIPVAKRGLVQVPHVGTVTLGTAVEVGANACIDRGALGNTSIGIGTKIDNLVQIGHNNKIGSHSVVCGLAGIAGSCSIGNEVVIGGGVGVRDHTTIGDKVRVGGQAGVITDLLDPGDYTGFPAIRATDWRRQAFRAIKDSQGRKKSPRK